MIPPACCWWMSAGLPAVGISVSDLDDSVAPPMLVQVTVDVLHGGLVLGTTTGLTFTIDNDGDGFDDSVLAATDGVEPRVADTYQKLVFRGTIDDVNAALATLRYYGDADFNTGTLPEVLTVEVNDLGNRDAGDAAGQPRPRLSAPH